MRTSRPVGDDAVSRTTSAVGLDDTIVVSSHQHQSIVIKEQLAIVLCRPSPGPVRPVSDERIAPMRLLPTAQPSLKFDGVLPAMLVKIRDSFAGKVGL